MGPGWLPWQQSLATAERLMCSVGFCRAVTRAKPRIEGSEVTDPSWADWVPSLKTHPLIPPPYPIREGRVGKAN